MVSNENLAVNLIENSLYVMNCFFFLCRDSLFVFQLFGNKVSQCGSLCLSFLELIELLGCVVRAFCQILEVFSHYFFRIVFLFLSVSPH